MNDNLSIRLLDEPDPSDGPVVEPPPAGFVRRQIELPIRDDRLRIVLDIAEAGTARLADVVPVIRRIDDRVIDCCLAQAAEEGRKPYCRPGCQACCRSYLLVFAPAEMYYQMELLDSLAPSLAAGARRWLARHADEMRRSGLLDRLGDPAPGDRPLDIIQEWFIGQEDTICPFLNVDDGVCRIYADRFVCCREFHSLRPPADCERHQTSRLAITPSLIEVGCELESRLTGGPVGAISMPATLLWHKARAVEASRRWPAPLMAEQLLGVLADTAQQARRLRASATVERSDDP